MKSFNRTSDTLAIVGFAPSTRTKAPWNNPKINFMGLNEEYAWDWFKQEPENITVWLQIHKRNSFSRPANHNDEKHFEWLKQEHPLPILMLEEFPDIPSSIRYPIEEVTKLYGGYWRSSLAYAVAWAHLVGYKRIELYGFEMGSDSEYWGQRANACYIIGKTRGKGTDVYVPPLSKLLTGIRYAYESSLIGARQDLETNLVQAKNDKRKIEAELAGLQGQLSVLEPLAKQRPELVGEMQKVKQEYKEKFGMMNLSEGRGQGIQLAMKLFDTFDILESESDYV